MSNRASRLGRSAGLVVLGLLAGLGCSSAAPQEGVPPRFEGKFVPDPPRQGDPWTAPATRLPRFLVNATGPLFDQGVADPRGCEYRQVTMADWQVHPARGFVLPERADVPGRFFIGWDGLIYRALTVGEPADLDRDIQGFADGLSREREPGRLAVDDFRGGTNWGFLAKEGEFFTLSGVNDHSPIKLCLLLRLGRADLAEVLFAAGTSWTPDGKSPTLTSYGMNAYTLATDWVTSAYSRLLSARRPDDLVIAVDLARRLTRFRDRAGPRLEALGFTRPDPSRWGGEAKSPSWFPVLGQLDDLRADSERRLSMPPRTPIPPKGGGPAARVAALIRDLDLINEPQQMSPGSAHPGSSPLVSALVEEGDAAVGPLLAVLESDNRLTLSVSQGRGNEATNYVHPVYEPAFVALCQILKTGAFTNPHSYPFQTPDPQARQALARSIREHWEQNKALPLVEQWYRVLLDDKAGAEQWERAAATLAYPLYVEGQPVAPPGTKPPFGEPIRVGHEPTVTALVGRRIDRLWDLFGNPASEPAFVSAVHLATALASWEPKAARPRLVELGRGCRGQLDAWRASRQNNGSPQGLVRALVQLTNARVELGDLGALDDYADWLRTTSPAMLDYCAVDAFEPLLDHEARPSLASASLWLFTDPKSPWVPLGLSSSITTHHGSSNLFASPLVTLAGFRAGLLVGLLDKRPCGTVKKGNDAWLEYKFLEPTDSTYSSRSYLSTDLEPGVEVAFRNCDYLAARLSEIEGSPRVELYWPEARRDEALARMAAYLKRYGDRFTRKPHPDQHDFPEAHAHLALPVLGRPASAEDVAEARAIFTLGGAGEVRVVPLPGFPQAAQWLTLKDSPVDLEDQAGFVIRKYLTDGWVWQAEEVRVGDAWERYYGFVGRHVIARVPASELEFGGDGYSPWGDLNGGCGSRAVAVEPPGTTFKPGQPLVARLEIQNRLVVDRSYPTEFVRVGADGRPSLRRGVTLQLWYAPPEKLTTSRFQGEDRQEVPRRWSSEFEPGEASRRLGPLESIEVGRVNVNDWFDTTRPGQYFLSLRFAAGSGLGEGTSGRALFEVVGVE